MKFQLNELVKRFVTMSLIASIFALPTLASSHAEAPLISMDRFADNTDTYAFRSTEPGRSGFVTLMANYIPFQEPSGGPQFYRWDDTVLYEIKIDNTGDGVENITYQFRFKTNTVSGETILGHNGVNEDGVINSLTDLDYNMPQTYTVTRTTTNDKKGTVIASGLRTPPNNIGPNTTPNYEANLGSQAVYSLGNGGRVFAGQRDEYFYIDLGGVFDRLALRSITQDTDGNFENGGIDSTKGYNVSTLAIEVPIQDLTKSGAVPTSATSGDAVIGVWATASRSSTRVLSQKSSTPKNTGNMVQVSRLGNPLVNEVVIPLKLKDDFNASTPKDDSEIAPFVLDPQLAQLLSAVYGLTVPAAPRNDLVSIFATGIPVNSVTGPNYTTFLSDGIPHEYLRLNVAIAPTASPSRLGLLGGDVAGFPNGRRPFDDVVDIGLRAVAGGTPFTPATNVFPNNALGDGVSFNPEGPLLSRFPYLLSPNPGNTARTSNITSAP